jgi:hypothetical protein
MSGEAQFLQSTGHLLNLHHEFTPAWRYTHRESVPRLNEPGFAMRVGEGDRESLCMGETGYWFRQWTTTMER